tara:strand:- start:207 stop:509 length:303 start_codon:yes stop_codon:yes gene_type:complete
MYGCTVKFLCAPTNKLFADFEMDSYMWNIAYFTWCYRKPLSGLYTVHKTIGIDSIVRAAFSACSSCVCMSCWGREHFGKLPRIDEEDSEEDAELLGFEMV